MKVCLKNISKVNLSDCVNVIKDFCQFLQDELKLKDGVTIHFAGDREVKMTTGVRRPGSQIYVLSKNRLLIDILRTLAHEWVHEYQHQKMGVSDEEEIEDIGGPEENMASILASIFLKKFQKQNPEHQKKLFGEQIIKIRKPINELSPESTGVKEFLNDVEEHPELLKHLGFQSMKVLKDYISDADNLEFDELKKEVDYFYDRRKRYLKAEMDEIERVVQYLNREEKMNVSVEDVYGAFDKAKEITLPTEVMKKLENSECNQFKKGEVKKVIALAKKYNKQDPRELSKALKSGDYKRPLILKFGDRFHLVAGNTRLCTAAVMGIRPQVLIGEI